MDKSKPKKKRVVEVAIRRMARLCKTIEEGIPVEHRYTIRTLVLDLQPPPFDPEAIRVLRYRLRVSQAVFAQIMGVSKVTVSHWEQGRNEPTPMACRLMEEIDRNLEYWRTRLKMNVKEEPVA